MSHHLPVAVILLVTLLAGCGGSPAAPGAPTMAPAATTAAESAAGALAAYEAARTAPADHQALRLAFDRVELALAVGPDDPVVVRALLAAEADLVARLAALERSSATPVAQASPTAVATATAEPSPTPAVTSTPTATPKATGAAAPRPRPTAAPQGASFAVANRKSFDGSGNSGQFASCIDVQILGRRGPVSGAVLGINNGEHSYQNQTDQNGYAGRCGLGASTWSVVLFWAPERGQVRSSATTVYLNGAPEQRAAVVFQER